MAIPTSAAASAGASLTPSPTKADRTAFCQFAQNSDLAVRPPIREDLLHAGLRGDRSRGGLAVAGESMRHASLAPAKEANAAAASGRTGSATANRPRPLPSTPTKKQDGALPGQFLRLNFKRLCVGAEAG